MVDFNQTLSTLPDVQLDPTQPCPDHNPIKLPTVDPKTFETTLSNKPLDSERKRFDLIEMGSPQRPQVPQETPCTLFAALQAHIRFEDLQARGLEVFGKEIDFDLQEIERREKEFASLIKEAMKQQQTTSNWSTLGDIVNYLTTSSSLVVGATMAFAGSYLAAGALIASAGLGLANLIIRDTIGWDTVAKYFSSVKETQEKLEQNLQIGFAVVALGLGVAGALSQMGQMAQLIQNNDVVARTFNAGLQLANGSTNLGTSFQQRKYDHLKAKQVQHRQVLEERHTTVSSKNDDIVEDLRRSQTQAHLAGQLIASQHSLTT